MRTLFLALALLSATPAVAAQTIVGEWALAPADCATQNAYRIGRRSIVTDEMRCDFDGVSRKGDTVRFEGRCGSGGQPERETVVATRTGDRLALRYLRAKGGVELVACRTQAPSASRPAR